MSYKMRPAAVKAANDISEDIKSSYKDFRIGVLDGRGVALRVPSFDCDWYWGFGYLGNRDCHFHLNWLESMDDKLNNKNLFDQLKGLFGDSLTIPDKNLWQFCEIVKTIYSLKDAAEVFGRGGSHYTTNPDAEAIKDTDIVEKINVHLIPMQIRTLWKLLEECK